MQPRPIAGTPAPINTNIDLACDLSPTYVIVRQEHAFLCGHCSRISFNPNDVRELYCARCKVFHTPTVQTERTLILQRLIDAFLSAYPVWYLFLATRTRRPAIDIESYITPYAEPGTHAFDAAYITTLWLLKHRSTTP